MKFEQYTQFRLSKPLPDDDSIPVGYIGCILEIWGGDPCAYEVEFPDENGCNIGKCLTRALTEDYMETVEE